MIHSQKEENYLDKFRQIQFFFEEHIDVFSQFTQDTTYDTIVRIAINSITDKAEIILINPVRYDVMQQNYFNISVKNRLEAIKEDFPEFDLEQFIILPQPGIHFASFSYKEIKELGWDKASKQAVTRYYKEVMDIDTTGMTGKISEFTTLMKDAIVTGNDLGFNCLYVENEIDNWRWIYSSEENMQEYFKPYEIYRTIEIS